LKITKNFCLSTWLVGIGFKITLKTARNTLDGRLVIPIVIYRSISDTNEI
jgi:hypothetical protein